MMTERAEIITRENAYAWNAPQKRMICILIKDLNKMLDYGDCFTYIIIVL